MLGTNFVPIFAKHNAGSAACARNNKYDTNMKNFKPAAWFLPQPVVIIGTYDSNGNPNAMNAAWAGQWDGTQVMISLASHQTTDNLEREGEFTVTFATREQLVAADYVGIVSGRKVPDKVARTGWTVARAEQVNAPVFTDFPLTLECRVKQKIDESATGYYLIGEIVNIQAREDVLGPDGKPDVAKMGLITYEGVHHSYIALGEKVGNAFADGKQLAGK